jgi:hypothetical protein
MSGVNPSSDGPMPPGGSVRPGPVEQEVCRFDLLDGTGDEDGAAVKSESRLSQGDVGSGLGLLGPATLPRQLRPGFAVETGRPRHRRFLYHARPSSDAQRPRPGPGPRAERGSKSGTGTLGQSPTVGPVGADHLLVQIRWTRDGGGDIPRHPRGAADAYTLRVPIDIPSAPPEG